jgi:hypothetical protein
LATYATIRFSRKTVTIKLRSINSRYCKTNQGCILYSSETYMPVITQSTFHICLLTCALVFRGSRFPFCRFEQVKSQLEKAEDANVVALRITSRSLQIICKVRRRNILHCPSVTQYDHLHGQTNFLFNPTMEDFHHKLSGNFDFQQNRSTTKPT